MHEIATFKNGLKSEITKEHWISCKICKSHIYEEISNKNKRKLRNYWGLNDKKHKEPDQFGKVNTFYNILSYKQSK